MNLVDSFYHSIINDYGIPSNIQVLNAFYGENNISNEDNLIIIYGVYRGLYFKGVDKDLFHKCYISNNLDKLIHKKYSHRKSKYYLEFIDKNIEIGKTYDNNNGIYIEENREFENAEEYLNFIQNNQIKSDIEVLDENYCLSCYSEGYYSNKNYINDAAPDCYICYKHICKLCSYYDENEDSYKCFQCESGNLKQNIKNKLSKYKHTDKNQFGYEGDLTYEDVLELLRRQKFTCYICNDSVMTSKWKPYCCYQFSVDRICNRLPHNKNNVLISCYYCNCRYFSEFNQDYKICDSGCHTVQRILPHKREVSKDKIDALLLK
jgi:hypothetical protein